MCPLGGAGKHPRKEAASDGEEQSAKAQRDRLPLPSAQEGKLRPKGENDSPGPHSEVGGGGRAHAAPFSQQPATPSSSC